MKNTMRTILLAIVVLLGILGMVFFVYLGKKRDKVDQEYAKKINAEYQKEIEEKRGRDFYEKIKNKGEVSILVLGDEVGLGGGARKKKTWPELLKNKLKDKYGASVSISNMSIQGATSYAGYAQVKTMSDSTKYDLVITCFGRGEEEKEFAFYSECMLRAIKERYENSSIIMIEEDLSNINKKLAGTLEKIANHYKAAFAKVGEKLENLQEGQEIYANAILNTIGQESQKNREKNEEEIPAINEETLKYNRCQFIQASEMATAERNRFSVKGNIRAVVAIDMDYKKGDRAKLLVDNKEIIIDLESLSKSQEKRIILPVTETLEAKSDISIVFENEESASRFKGFIFNYMK